MAAAGGDAAQRAGRVSEAHSFFLVIEGLDGSGKSVISRHLNAILRETMGERVKLTFEPHDPSAAGLFIRQALMRKIVVSPRTLALAYALNRADHNERVVQPFLAPANALDAGRRVMICDRYYLSSLVYQSVPPLTMHDVWMLNAGARRPDLTLFMDASAATCYKRMGVRGGNRELFDQNLEARRELYMQGIAFLRDQGDTVIEVDANPDLLDVLNSIIDILNQYGPEWLRIQRPLLIDDGSGSSVSVPNKVDVPSLIDRAKTAAQTSGVSPAAALAAEIHSLLPNELAGLALACLAQVGYEVGERAAFEEAPLYRLIYSLPGGIALIGAIILLPETGRYDLVTKVVQYLETDRMQAGCAFLLALDPGAVDSPLQQYEREYGSPLSLATHILGRQALVEMLAARAHLVE